MAQTVPQVTLTGIPRIPLIKRGDSVAALTHSAAAAAHIGIQDDDLLVIAQKIVSKAEGATVSLSEITPSEKALELAAQTGRDPRLCQVYLDESREILGVKGRMVITRHHLGFECSSAGVDRSNVAPQKDETVVLLPRDPDESARRIRAEIRQLTGVTIGVIISDSFGRPGRQGSVGIAIGLAGLAAIEERKQLDLFDNPSNNRIALIDEVAAAASLLMGQANEGIPAVLVRGVNFKRVENTTIEDILS